MKNFLALVMAVCVAMVSIVTLNASEVDSVKMENALIKVKQIIDIPDEYSEFVYSFGSTDDSAGKWSFSWSDVEGTKKIRITANEKGEIIRYSKYDDEPQKIGLSKITGKEAEKIALEFINKVSPQFTGKIKVENNKSQSGSENYVMDFRVYEEDIPIGFAMFSLDINKYNGEINNFVNDAEKLNSIKIIQLKNDIGEVAAKNAYIDKLGLSLKYYINTDYQKKQVTAFPAYSLNDKNLDFAIYAATGDKFEINKYENIEFRSNESGSARDQDNSAITKNEQEALKAVEGLMTKESAEEIIKSAATELSGNVTGSGFLKDIYDKNKIVLSVEFSDGSGSVNAKTGELLNFEINNKLFLTEAEAAVAPKLTEQEAKAVADTFLVSIANDKFAQTRPDSEYTVERLNMPNDSLYYFNYVRQVNGIDFDANGLKVNVNKFTGKVMQFKNTWNDNLTFQPLDKAINKNEAFDKICEYGDFTKMYCLKGKFDAEAVYNFMNGGNILVDPFDGKRLDYQGKEYKLRLGTVSYNDLKDHWSEEIVNALVDTGYILAGEEFLPDKNITQVEFLNYLYSLYSSDEEEYVYRRAIGEGLLSEEEKAPTSVVTREKMAKMAAGYLGYSKIGERSELFVNNFNETIDKEYKGYAAICYGFGIMKPNEDGKFNGDENMTRAHAAEVIYNILKAQEE